MNSPAMDRFETILNFAIENQEKADAKAEILKAADQLLEDSAIEMVDASINGVCIILLQIYENGSYPGKATNPLLDRLQVILAEAGKSREDSAAHDSY